MNEAAGVASRSVSQQNGEYTFSNLSPGLYSTTTNAPGFSRLVQQHVLVAVGTTTPADVTLRSANVEQTVTVSATAEVVETQTSSIGTVVTPREIEDLPVPMSSAGIPLVADRHVHAGRLEGAQKFRSQPWAALRHPGDAHGGQRLCFHRERQSAEPSRRQFAGCLHVLWKRSGPQRNGPHRQHRLQAIQPRRGSAFTPFNDRKTSFRGGYSITRPAANENLENGIGSAQYSIGFSGAAIASKPGDTVVSPAFYLDKGFPVSGVTPPVLSPGILVGLTNPVIIYPSAGSPPTQMNWALEVQQELPGKFVGSIAYIGTHTYHIGVWSKPNQINPLKAQQYAGAAAAAGLPLNQFLQQPIMGAAAVSAAAGLSKRESLGFETLPAVRPRQPAVPGQLLQRIQPRRLLQRSQPECFIFNNAPGSLAASVLANSNSVFGLLTAQQNGPRIIQLALKLEF